MTRAKKILLWSFAGLLLLLAVLLVFVATFDWNRAKPTINERVSAALGRPFSIDGNLAVDWRREPEEKGWRAQVPWPHVSAEKLRVGNPGWAKGDHLVALERVEASLSPLALLWKTVRIPHIQLSAADAGLERLADGRDNWTFELGSDETKQEPSAWTLDIGSIGFDKGQLRYHDQILRARLQVDVQPLGKPIPFSDIVGKARAGAGAPQGGSAQDYAFAWQASGSYREQPVSGEGKLGGLLALQDAAQPFPLQVDLRAGASRVQLEGTLSDPKNLGALDLRLRLSGDSLGNLQPLIGVVLPDSPDYATDGRLLAQLQDADGARYEYRDFNGRIGDSDIHGSLTFVARQPRPKLSGRLTSNQLRFSDLAPLIGADANPEKNARGAPSVQPADRVLPHEQFDTGAWRSMDADVSFTGRKIVHGEQLPLSDLSTHLLLDDGALSLRPLRFGMAGGTLDAHVELDGRQAPLQGRAQLKARQLKLKQLFPSVQAMQTSLGELNGDAGLAGSGNSVAALLGSANGELRLLMNDGVVSRGLMEIAGLNLGNYLASRLFGDDQVRINCIGADLGVKDGLATSRVVLFDTENAVIRIDGWANLQAEQMDLEIVPASKGLRVISLRSPLYVRGTFKEPRAGVQAGRLAVRGAGLLALGLAVAPAAGLLALVAPSGGQADQCAPVLQQMDN
jgi:uncharacterized protein involved in outer membrane biogenesis